MRNRPLAYKPRPWHHRTVRIPTWAVLVYGIFIAYLIISLSF